RGQFKIITGGAHRDPESTCRRAGLGDPYLHRLFGGDLVFVFGYGQMITGRTGRIAHGWSMPFGDPHPGGTPRPPVQHHVTESTPVGARRRDTAERRNRERSRGRDGYRCVANARGVSNGSRVSEAVAHCLKRITTCPA